jgi:hypothetical protein
VTETIANRPAWRLVFDKNGDVDQQTLADLKKGIRDNGITDLVMFSPRLEQRRGRREVAV